MRHIPHSSRVFIGLVVITLLLTYLALDLSFYKQHVLENQDTKQPEHQVVEPEVTVDTTDWKQYVDKTYPIAFSYPEDWTVKSSTNAQKFYDVVLNPGPKDPNMHIYISDKGYYGLDGLDQTPYVIGGRKGFTVSNNLMGIKVGEYYYTFDGSMNTTNSDEFAGLLTQVNFQ